MVRTLVLSALVAAASAFAPAQVSQRTSVALNAEMSKSIPFLVRPEKLDGSLPGDMGFDPMGLTEIQNDLNYAAAAEIKHGRICMLAIVGMVVQESGLHWPGEAYTNTDPFGAISSVGWGPNLQIFTFIACAEIATFSKAYGDDTPGDFGFDYGLLSSLSEEEVFARRESEVVHGRLAMIALTGAVVQTLLYHKPLLEIF
mmetsp:Transcript_5790/g.10096  ORF Transcript_5790/g.10096 Transcript_5790/m.10096 type:complete len:200 (-) Transcript_5790:1884-2483(-)